MIIEGGYGDVKNIYKVKNKIASNDFIKNVDTLAQEIYQKYDIKEFINFSFEKIKANGHPEYKIEKYEFNIAGFSKYLKNMPSFSDLKSKMEELKNVVKSTKLKSWRDEYMAHYIRPGGFDAGTDLQAFNDIRIKSIIDLLYDILKLFNLFTRWDERVTYSDEELKSLGWPEQPSFYYTFDDVNEVIVSGLQSIELDG
jgi:hypothetical protein